MKAWIVILMVLTAGCATAPVVDPNDPIYTGSVRPSDKWIQKFGDNDRTRLFFNAAVSRAADAALAKRLNVLEKQVNELRAGEYPNGQRTENDR